MLSLDYHAINKTHNYFGNLSSCEFETEYRTAKDNPIEQFYTKCLRNSQLYRRAVGYFRSTVFIVTGAAVIEFAKRGGKILLICSPKLEYDDVEQIALGYSLRSATLERSLISQFDALLADTRTAMGAKILATLISVGSLEIKLAERVDRKGLYHEKLGLFSDGIGNTVSFKGSSNETWNGWHDNGNFESIEVFCNWRAGLEETRVQKHIKHFESLWAETDPHVAVTKFPTTVEEYMKKFAAADIDELLATPATSHSSSSREALPHQISAISAWEKHGRRGILEHATGSGKTFTALIALRKHLQQGLPALVLVPSVLLHEQWAKEISRELPDAIVLRAGGGFDQWKQGERLKSMTAPDPVLGPRVVLAMMPTAAQPAFCIKVCSGEHLLLIADEVHQLGSPRNSQIFDLNAGARLGLSATPKRYGDSEGTSRLFSYFEGVIPPPITLQDAVKAGRLVPYEYHPHAVHLTNLESEEWRKESRMIQLEMAKQKTDADGNRALSERAKMLLIKRSRIAKKATAKVQLAVNIINEYHEEGQSWLVYCEDSGQLNDVKIALHEAGHKPLEYHSNMSGDRDATMGWFRRYGGILLSIKCLDEGVDIPDVSHALILASSQNPRQFIQRRGRVLRKSSGKYIAVIHDAIVIPVDAEKEPEQISLLKAELLRAIEFANNAINKTAGADLRSIAINLGINPDEIMGDVGSEDDEL